MKTHFTLKQHLIATLQVLLLIGLITLLMCATACSGCSKSGQLASIPQEKVVIIDSYPTNVDTKPITYKYKVKRIEKGVVDIIYDYDLYEKSDTILHRFIR